MLSLIRFWFRAGGWLFPGLVAGQAARLFMTPGRHKPQYPQSQAIFAEAEAHWLEMPHGRMRYYQWPATDGAPRVLMAHGWSDLAENLLPLIGDLREQGFAVTALDWPAHGASDGRITNMREWLSSIRRLSAEHGPWHAVVAHSLGAFCTAMSVREDIPMYGEPLHAERLVLIAPPESSMQMLRLFSEALAIRRGVRDRMERIFDGILGSRFAEYSVGRALQAYQGRALVIHDRNDKRVPFESLEIARGKAPAHEYLVTRGLGHRRILEDENVRAAIRTHLTAAEERFSASRRRASA